MSAVPVPIGLVGCGRLAEAGYLPALRHAPGARLVAVADPDPSRRRRVAALAGIEHPACFASAADLIAAAGVEGLVLATPAAAHLDDATRAARAGLAVLIEKPPAPDGAGAAAIAELSPVPWIGFNRRFDPGAAALRGAVPSAGEVDLVLEISYRRRSWNAHDVRDDALLDLGPHLVDWARWISGDDVLEVSSGGISLQRAALELVMGRGRAVVRAATDRPHAELVEVRDRRGRLLARHRLGGLAAAVTGRLRRGGPSALVGTLAAQLEAFAGAIRGAGPSSLGTARDALQVMQVLDAARASAAAGGHTVRLSEPAER